MEKMVVGVGVTGGAVILQATPKIKDDLYSLNTDFLHEVANMRMPINPGLYVWEGELEVFEEADGDRWWVYHGEFKATTPLDLRSLILTEPF